MAGAQHRKFKESKSWSLLAAGASAREQLAAKREAEIAGPLPLNSLGPEHGLVVHEQTAGMVVADGVEKTLALHLQQKSAAETEQGRNQYSAAKQFPL